MTIYLRSRRRVKIIAAPSSEVIVPSITAGVIIAPVAASSFGVGEGAGAVGVGEGAGAVGVGEGAGALGSITVIVRIVVRTNIGVVAVIVTLVAVCGTVGVPVISPVVWGNHLRAVHKCHQTRQSKKHFRAD
jgi:hypothetical protein